MITFVVILLSVILGLAIAYAAAGEIYQDFKEEDERNKRE